MHYKVNNSFTAGALYIKVQIPECSLAESDKRTVSVNTSAGNAAYLSRISFQWHLTAGKLHKTSIPLGQFLKGCRVEGLEGWGGGWGSPLGNYCVRRQQI